MATKLLSIVLRTTGFPLLPALIFVAADTSVLTAQTTGVLHGTVTTAGEMPVAEARVRVLGSDRSTLTSSDGAFRVSAVPVGRQSLEVRMVGYAPQIVPVNLGAGANLQLKVILEPLPLDTVRVTADADFSPGMGSFDERRAHGNGHFFTRPDIEKMHARQITDILRRVPGMRIQNGSGAFGASQTAQTGRNISSAGSRTCPMAYYVNGTSFPLANDVPINHYFTPDDITAIEVYTGASQTPVQFNSTLSTSRCGVVVIWTRNGVDARARR